MNRTCFVTGNVNTDATLCVTAFGKSNNMTVNWECSVEVYSRWCL